MNTPGLRSYLDSFLADESGQDIIEYALLTAIIGIGAIAVWQALADTVGEVYAERDAAVQGLASPPDPM